MRHGLSELTAKMPEGRCFRSGRAFVISRPLSFFSWAVEQIGYEVVAFKGLLYCGNQALPYVVIVNR
ncbi:hypothetical protein AYM40_33615 [Paraburkholderia phytofirmans OLGA172]|uniref:Uncharacterized protein n=1 Tax=Paraburkholderia phytofirmans OLGA172 TaxID=1417228 RepID=A0A160FUU6_9BURK|nr:hypothetical protein AYM40_33615 [Paraburkholderia phytofirmans OLGA172]